MAWRAAGTGRWPGGLCPPYERSTENDRSENDPL